MDEIEQLKKEIQEMQSILVQAEEAHKACESASARLSKKQFDLWNRKYNLKDRIAQKSRKLVEMITSL